MASAPVPLDYVFSSKVVDNKLFNCEIYETVFRIPIKKLRFRSANPPRCAPCFGPWLDPEWVAWVRNHPAFNINAGEEVISTYSPKLSLLREVIWPAFASYMMARSVAQNMFFDIDILGMLNWYREVLRCSHQNYIELDSQHSDGLWWFMLVDSPWSTYGFFDDLLYGRRWSEPGPELTLSRYGLGFAPNCCSSPTTAFWDMKFPMDPGLEGLAVERLCQVMKENSAGQNWASQQPHWQIPKRKFIWIKYWGPRAYRGSVGDLLSQREQWFRSLRQAF